MKKLIFALCCLLLNLPFMIFGGGESLQEKEINDEIHKQPISQVEPVDTRYAAIRYTTPRPHP